MKTSGTATKLIPRRSCATFRRTLGPLLALALSFTTASRAAAPKPLNSIAAVLAELPTGTNPPLVAVQVNATVTFVDSQRRLLVVQDETAAMGMQLPTTNLHWTAGQSVKIEGDSIARLARAFPAYPDEPSRRGVISMFELPTGSTDYTLNRIRGYLHPPTTGVYTFWTTADDAGELNLSADAAPHRMQRIAGNRPGTATGPREWTRHPTQQSKPITLVAGTAYYVEALHTQSYGRNCFAVAWEGPGLKRSVIAAAHLTPWTEDPRATSAPPAVAPRGLLLESWTNFFGREYEALRQTNPAESILRLGSLQLTETPAIPPPKPLRLPGDSTLETVPNLRWVELQGEVTFVTVRDGGLQLELKRPNGVLGVTIRSWRGRSAESLWHAVVRLRGVLEHTFDSSGKLLDHHLWLNDERAVELLETAAPQTGRADQVTICDLNPADPEMRWGRRISVLGRIRQDDNTASILLQGGDNFTAFCSADGRTWLPLGKAVEIRMAPAAQVGLAIVSRHDTTPSSASFGQLRGFATNWSGAEIGDPAQPGQFHTADGVVTITGSGRKIGERGDQLFYVHQPAPGEVEIRAHLTDLVYTNSLTQAGLMIRDSLNARAPFAAVLFTPASGPAFQYRQHLGDPAVGFESRRAYTGFRWLKLVRQNSLLRVLGQPQTDLDTNELVAVTGVLIWQADGTPVLSKPVFAPAPETNPAPSPAAAELITISSFVTKAQYPLEPYLLGRMVSPRLSGVVTYCGEVHGTNVLFLQGRNDGGVRLEWGNPTAMPKFKVGQWLEFSGQAVVRKFPVILQPTDVKLAGWGSLPRPEPYATEFARTESAQACWVEATGVGRSRETNGILNLMTKDGPLAVWVNHDTPIVRENYIDAALQVRGVLSLDASRGVQLLVPGPEFVTVQERAPQDPFVIPGFPISRLGALPANPQHQRRMKVMGKVTGRLPAGIFLQDASGGVFVHTTTAATFRAGDQVEAVGFPDRRVTSLILTDALVRKTGETNEPAPQTISLSQKDKIGELADSLVAVEGILVEQRDTPKRLLLSLQLESRMVEAAYLKQGETTLPNLTVGSRVAVTGVCQVDRDAARLGLSEVDAISPAALFRLWLRTPDDVVVVARPPWWTLKRAAWTGVIIGCGLLGALLWAHTLRKRVAQSTRALQATMGQLEKETRTSAVLGERDRLAGEIHDSLQQGLAAIILQLDVAGKHSQDSPETRRLLLMARRMAEFSRAEVEHAVWDLQSPLLSNADLGTALSHVASLISPGTPQVTVSIDGTRRPLPSAVEHHLLRIGQEAITNAIKHAQAQNVHLTLSYSAADVQLTAQDDGTGFAPDAVLEGTGTGHFGLHGIRSRARKIAAHFSISSQPGQGTILKVQLPIPAENPPAPAAPTTSAQ